MAVVVRGCLTGCLTGPKPLHVVDREVHLQDKPFTNEWRLLWYKTRLVLIPWQRWGEEGLRWR
jgi:hypothetical protein